MAQHLAFGQTGMQHGVQGLHVEQALSAEAALAEQVLVDIGAGGAVRVDAALAGEQPVERCRLAGGRQRRDQMRLQDPEARHHAPAAAIEPGAVLRVRGHGDEVAQAPRWQLRVGIERDDVARGPRRTRQLAEVEERAVLAGGQCRHQLLELAALALPADPAPLRLAEAALAVQQQEPRRRAGRRRMARVEIGDLLPREIEQRGIGVQVFGVGVGPVAEQRELRLGFRVGERVQQQPVHERRDGLRTAEQRRNHDDHAVRGRDAAGPGEARQMAWPRRLADEPVHHRSHRLRRRKEHQHGRRGDPGPGGTHRLREQPCHQHGAGTEQRQQIGRQCGAPHQRADRRRRPVVQAQAGTEFGAPGTAQPVARERRVASVGSVAAHVLEQRLRDDELAAAAAARESLDVVQGPVARVGVLGLEQRRGEHALHQHAGAADDVGPVGIADRAQRGHRIADAQVVRGLTGKVLGLRFGEVGQRGVQPGLEAGRTELVGGSAPVAQPDRELREEHPPDAAPDQQREHFVEHRHPEGLDAVGTQVGHLACGLVAGHALGEPAQVLDQQHAQSRGQCPHLAQAQLARLLVAVEEVREQLVVECAVGVRDERPGHAVDARQSREGLVLQQRQRAEVAARQRIADLLELRLDEVEVVEQPLGRGTHVVAGGSLLADRVVRLAQHADVGAQAREESGRGQRGAFGAVRLPEAAAVLRKALRAEDLGADRRLRRAAARIEDVAKRARRVRKQALPGITAHLSSFPCCATATSSVRAEPVEAPPTSSRGLRQAQPER